MCVGVYVYISHMCTYVYVYVYVHICVYIYIYIHMYYVCVYIHIYIYIYIYTHTVWSRSWWCRHEVLVSPLPWYSGPDADRAAYPGRSRYTCVDHLVYDTSSNWLIGAPRLKSHCPPKGDAGQICLSDLNVIRKSYVGQIPLFGSPCGTVIKLPWGGDQWVDG